MNELKSDVQIDTISISHFYLNQYQNGCFQFDLKLTIVLNIDQYEANIHFKHNG